MAKTQETSPASTPATTAPDERGVFVLADDALLRVLHQVRDDQWDLPTRDAVTTNKPDTDPSLREIVNQHAYEDAWVPAMLAGRTMAEVGEDAFTGDLLGDDPAAAYERYARHAVEAARALPDPERTVHCSFGDFSARDFLRQSITYRGLRAVEIARLVGADDTLPDDLVAGLLAYMREDAEQWRAWGVLGPELPAPPDATPQERLLAITGRRPR